jgi:NAD(P)H dehydrogenase (quinone)
MTEIIIVGGAGWAGIELVRQLIAVDADFGVISHSEVGSARLRAVGARCVARADLGDPSTLRSAFTGALGVYAIPPALQQSEDEFIINAVRVAEMCGVERFTYHSVLHPNTPFLRNHLRKARVESVLQSSRLTWTIVQPSLYAQVLMAMYTDLPAGVVGVPFDIDSEIAVLDIAECAEVGVKILTQPGVHDYATYELAGPPTTMRSAVAAVAHARGIELQPVTVPAHQGMLPPAAETCAEAAADMISTYAHYDRHGFRGNPFVLTQLLSRPAASFEDVVARHLTLPLPSSSIA